MSQPALTYQSTKPLQTHRDPDGTLRIDIAPIGTLRAVEVMSGAKPGSALGLLIFLAICLAAPIIILGGVALSTAGDPMFIAMLLLAPVAIAAFGGILGTLVLRHARRRTHIAVTTDRFKIDETGVGDEVHFDIPRNQVRGIEAGVWRVESSILMLLVRCEGHEVPRQFIGYLPPQDTREIAQLLRLEMDLTDLSIESQYFPVRPTGFPVQPPR